MKKIETYNQIQLHKQEGLSRYRTAQLMKISQMTVSKYWDMTEQEFTAITDTAKTRTKLALPYKDEIITILKQYPEMSSDNIAKTICIMRGVDSLDVKGHAFHNYVQSIRKEYGFPKPRSSSKKLDNNSPVKKSIHDRLRENKKISQKTCRATSPKIPKNNRNFPEI